MTQIAAPAVVDAPPAAPPPLSLVAAARTGVGDRWEGGGVTYPPEGCASHGVIDPCSTASFGPTTPGNPTVVVGRPFVVWAADECSTLGFQGRDWEGRVRRALLAATPFEVEREFWAGTLSQAAGYGNRFLAGPGMVDITPAGGAVAPLDGIACLEQALGETATGGQGMIHATRKVALKLSQLGILRRQGNMLLTDVDTVVVPGVGYPGTGPEIAAPANLVATPGTDVAATLANDTYEYVVTGLTADGETLPSAQASATVTAGGTGKVDLTWNALSGATGGYRIYGRQAGSLVLLGTNAAGDQTFTDTGAAPAGPGTPPTADTSGEPDPSQHWIYATDYVSVYLSDPQIVAAGDDSPGRQFGVFDGNVNTLRNRAERFAAVSFDGCRHFGIRVQVPTCGGSF